MMDTELMAKVRKVVADNPERHDQSVWISNVFNLYGASMATAGEARAWAFQDVPDEPMDDDRPVCGTTGCVAGWVVILSAPKSAKLGPYMITTARGEYSIGAYAARKLGLKGDQQRYLFTSSRTRDEVLAALAYLPDHPRATLAELVEHCGDEAGEFG